MSKRRNLKKELCLKPINKPFFKVRRKGVVWNVKDRLGLTEGAGVVARRLWSYMEGVRLPNKQKIAQARWLCGGGWLA